MSPAQSECTYGTRNLDIDLGEFDKRLVEVLDRLGSVLGGLVAHIAYPPMRKEFDVCDGELGKVLAHVVLSELGRQSAHEDTRRFHSV